ncbi:MAG: hypothetical protein HY023_06025, partial [Chloroflexi bacterium]|nr:hypothetical protein [Chloroflexota bacterium]
YDCAELQGGYGGFPGPQSFHTEVAHSIYDRQLAEYQASGIEYLIADNRASGFFSGAVAPAFAANVKEVARFQDGEFVGPDRVIFQVPPIQQHALYRRIGDAISFRGFDLPQTTVVAGKDLSVTLYWMSARTTPANLIVFVHLAKDENSAPVAQFDGPPLNGTQPTFEWGGDMQFWIDPRTIPLAADVPPGQYQLRVGMYDADTGERLSVRSPKGEEQGTAMLLGEITVAR